MIKHTIFTFCFIACAWSINAQKLSFHKDGSFKITQFTDTHICAEKPESDTCIQMINATLTNEHPDLIIFSGDVVTGKPAVKGWKMVMDPIAKSGIPFCVVLGNHDDEQDISREEIAKIVTSYPNNLNTIKNGQLEDLVLSINSSSSKETAALIYCIDSHAYSSIDTVKGYGWFSNEQVNWYRKTSAGYSKQNGGKPYPALAFFHIPLPEYKQAFENKKGHQVGHRLEDECSPKINTGMFASFLECKDVMGTFVGHDHNNDYAASLYGITLCYGRFSGGNTTYNDVPNGSRIIKLKEGDYGFSTWIREKGNVITDRSFWQKKQNKILYNAFSHNDYENKYPLTDALNYGFNNVEADIHLIDGKLFVAHNYPKDTTGGKNLEELYFKPLADRISINGGKVHSNGKGPFYLMIDFKSDGEKTYKTLKPLLEKYKDILCSSENGEFKERAVLLFFSGNRPFKSLPKEKVRYAFIDGRVADSSQYPSSVMPVVSNSFYDIFSRESKTDFSQSDLEKLRSLILEIHGQGKKLRFWGVPNTDAFKKTMMREGVDLIGTDHIDELATFLNNPQ